MIYTQEWSVKEFDEMGKKLIEIDKFGNNRQEYILYYCKDEDKYYAKGGFSNASRADLDTYVLLGTGEEQKKNFDILKKNFPID